MSARVRDCRDQEILVGACVVAAGNEGRLFECRVVGLETGAPGMVMLHPEGYPDTRRLWLPADHVAVVTG